MDQYASLLRGKLVILTLLVGIGICANPLYRAVKMSILALYYRIVSGKRGLPWIVQPKAVWWIAGVFTLFHIAVFTVRGWSRLDKTITNVKQSESASVNLQRGC